MLDEWVCCKINEFRTTTRSLCARGMHFIRFLRDSTFFIHDSELKWNAIKLKNLNGIREKGSYFCFKRSVISSLKWNISRRVRLLKVIKFIIERYYLILYTISTKEYSQHPCCVKYRSFMKTLITRAITSFYLIR